jgi:hypothetical protein
MSDCIAPVRPRPGVDRGIGGCLVDPPLGAGVTQEVGQAAERIGGESPVMGTTAYLVFLA